MEQLDLFESGELEPIQKWLHVWDEARREALRKNAPAQGRGEHLPRQGGGDGEGEHQAASNGRAGR